MTTRSTENITGEKQALLNKIKTAQHKWADNIVHIGKALINKEGSKEIKKRANKMLDDLYDFKTMDHILFKPTLAVERPFRFNRYETLSYFIGRNLATWQKGESRIAEDDGFALTPWKKVIFHDIEERNIIQQDCDYLVMGACTFIDNHDNEAHAEYTFGYRGTDFRVFLHHSSLPFSPELSELPALKEQAKNEQSATGFRIALPGEVSYESAREISNSYFNHKPDAVALPRAANQVAFSIRQFNKIDSKKSLRIMSGGHQHEGMSSGNNTFVIRLSQLGEITLNDDKTQAWIPAGMKLGDVYTELEYHNKMIPGGGCMNVNVGGLTQGGGWGMNSRKYGFSCDNIIAAEVVLASGDIVVASKDNHPNLFWAIRGGGGGNFGVVTRFLFKLNDISEELSVFRFFWKHDRMEEVIAGFLKWQKKFPDEMTSFLRVTAVPRPKKDYKDYPLYASGLFHGSMEELTKILAPLKADLKPNKSECFVRRAKGLTEDEAKAIRDVFSSKNFTLVKPADKKKSNTKEVGGIIPAPQNILDFYGYDVFGRLPGRIKKLNTDKAYQVPPPSSNCGTPHPHKVSSGFSNQTGQKYYDKVAKQVTQYFDNTLKGEYKQNLPFVRSYMTFHSMGGALAKEPEGGSAFAFRNTEFLIQIQSWWNFPTGKKGATYRKKKDWQQPYINWVTNFRAQLAKQKLIKGAFINFVDKDLGPDYKTEEGKYKLLEEYYDKHLDQLIDVKKTYDPCNTFNFQMSIPTRKPH